MSEDTPALEAVENSIQLSGSMKYATRLRDRYYLVTKGQVRICAVLTVSNKMGREVLVYEAGEGQKIPSLFTWDEGKQQGYMFFLEAMDTATVRELEYEDDRQEIEQAFLEEAVGPDIYTAEGQSLDLAGWIDRLYNGRLDREERLMKAMESDRVKAENARRNLITSVFSTKNRPEYGIDTESDLYNAVSLLCDYMNVKICPYRVVRDSRGDDFSVSDIARCSHFVARKVVLGKKWYKKGGDAFIGFYKDTGLPVVCIPKASGLYLLLDIKKQITIKVEDEEAANIEDEVYVIYQHLPSKSLGFKDLLDFGFEKVRLRELVVYFVMYLLVTLIGLLLPLLNSQLFDKLIPLGSLDPIYEIGTVIIAFMIGNVFFGIVQSLSAFRFIKTVEYRIVAATMDRIFKLPQKFIDTFGSGELVNRTSAISQAFSSTVTSGITAIVGFILGLVYLWRMFKSSSHLAWRGLILSLVTALIMFLIGYLRISRERTALEYSSKANGKLYTFLSSILKVKTSGIENRVLYEFEKDNVDSVKAHLKSTKVQYTSTVFTTIMTVINTLIIYHAVIVKESDFTIGDYTAFNSAYGMFSSASGQLVSFFVTVAALIPVMDRIRPIFKEAAEDSDEIMPVGRLKGNIEINHLDFAYEDDDIPVLKDINISIKSGEFIGIVGASGCGKSTLLKCLLGFENPTRGDIFYDNTDITTIDKSELRRQLGVVLQDGKMVVGNIYTNVSLSNPNMEPQEVLELLKDVGLYEDVMKMPMGIYTSISEGGGTVSGGQQQRILLARAIANDPSILLLDEATSALDNITQTEVCKRLADRNITRVMIAHRLSTVKDCDRIYVMENGRVEEEGTYQELMDKKGLFYTYAMRQQA